MAAVSNEQEQAVTAWLRQNALPMQYLETGSGFADLQPLKMMLKDAKIVGLGETTHGTREFFQIKHRLLEFLVTEMNFTVFTIEASSSACQPINDYVLYGKGDRASVLTGQWYIVWDTEEMGDLLDWMRAYNQSVPDEKKVKFCGLDNTRNGNTRREALDYLRKVDPDQVAATEVLFEALSVEEAKWPRRLDEAAAENLPQLLPRLQALIDHVAANKEAFIQRSSSAEFEQIAWYLQVMKQWVVTNCAALHALEPSYASRSLSMAENLIHLVGQAAAETKFIAWEHNNHIAVSDAEDSGLGYTLREKYGERYFAFGFEFNQGAFQTRLPLPPNMLGDLKVRSLLPSPEGSLPWYLSWIGTNVALLNLHAPTSSPAVKQWLNTSQSVHSIGWVCDDMTEYYEELNIAKSYDGLIFVETTTASRPTTNALQTAANRDGL